MGILRGLIDSLVPFGWLAIDVTKYFQVSQPIIKPQLLWGRRLLGCLKIVNKGIPSIQSFGRKRNEWLLCVWANSCVDAHSSGRIVTDYSGLMIHTLAKFLYHT